MKVRSAYLTLLSIIIGGGLILVRGAWGLTYQSNTNVSFTFNPAVTLAISSSNLLISNLAPGSVSDSNIISVTAGSNSGAGYYLYATAGSSTSGNTYYDTNALKHTTSGSTHSFTSLTSNASTASNITAGYWGYSYSAHNQNTWVSGSAGSASSGYNGLPKSTSGNGVALLNTTTAGSTVLDFKIAAKATTSQAHGTYGNVINFAVVAKPITTTYTITYNDATGTATGLPSTSASATISSGNTANYIISSTIPTRSGYAFKGWCTVTTTTDACTGNIYDAGSTYIVGNIGGTVTIPLYAMWKKLTVYMQYATFAQCGETMIDSRDGKEYTTALLADGKCWMTTNLNLAGGTALSADDTDVTSAYISSFSTSNNLTKGDNTIVLPASSISGFNTNNYSYVYNSTSMDCSSATGCYSYYSWDAATLGSGRRIRTDNTDAPYSICPKGWKLPTTYNGTNSTTDFRALMIAYGGSDSVQTYDSSTIPTGDTMLGSIGPNTTPNFLLTGDLYNGSFTSSGTAGNYWSATSGLASSLARSFYFFSTNVNTASSNLRGHGFGVRCLFDGQ